MSDFKWPSPRLVAPVKAAPSSELLDDWPILFHAGNSMEDGDNWGLCTNRVRVSELLDVEFPSDSKADSQFIAALINAYRTGKLVRREAE